MESRKLILNDEDIEFHKRWDSIDWNSPKWYNRDQLAEDRLTTKEYLSGKRKTMWDEATKSYK